MMNIKIDLGEILSKAWRIIWKFKVLWIFGILAGCGGANGSRFNFSGGTGSSGGTGGSGQFPAFSKFFEQFQNIQPDQIVRNFLDQYAAIIAAVIVVLCVVWLLF